MMREPDYDGGVGRTKRREPVRRRRTTFNLLGAVALLVCLGCATIAYWREQDRSARQADNPGTYGAQNGWTDGTLAPEDAKGSSRDLEQNFGKVGVLIVNAWHRLRELNPFESPATVTAMASLLVAFTCFFVACRSRGP